MLLVTSPSVKRKKKISDEERKKGKKEGRSRKEGWMEGKREGKVERR